MCINCGELITADTLSSVEGVCIECEHLYPENEGFTVFSVYEEDYDDDQ